MAKMVRISMEVIACHCVLQNLLMQMARGPDPWDSVYDAGTRSWTPPIVCTFKDVDNARAVSTLCRDQVDGSPEYATMRLVRWDYNQEEGVHWVPKEEYQEYKFRVTWNLFGRLWRMAVPIADERLRTSALANLSCLELDQLRMLLGDTGNTPMWVAEGEKFEEVRIFGWYRPNVPDQTYAPAEFIVNFKVALTSS